VRRITSQPRQSLLEKPTAQRKPNPLGIACGQRKNMSLQSALFSESRL
jgi:hypothetical protein